MWFLLQACKDRGDPLDVGPTDEADTDTDADADADVEPPEPVSRLRMVDVARGLGPIDVWIDGKPGPVLSAVEGPTGSRFFALTPGERTLTVTAVGAPITEPIASGTASLVDDDRSVAVLHGTPGAPAFVLLDERLLDLPVDRVRYTLFHAAPRLGEIDASTPLQTVPVAFGARVVLGDAGGGAASFTLDLDRDATPDCEFEIPDVGVNTLVATYLVERDAEIVVFGHHESGAFEPLAVTDPDGCRSPLPRESGDTAEAGGTADTAADSTNPGSSGDTGLPGGTGHTGSAVGGSGHTGHTGHTGGTGR